MLKNILTQQNVLNAIWKYVFMQFKNEQVFDLFWDFLYYAVHRFKSKKMCKSPFESKRLKMCKIQLQSFLILTKQSNLSSWGYYAERDSSPSLRNFCRISKHLIHPNLSKHFHDFIYKHHIWRRKAKSLVECKNLWSVSLFVAYFFHWFSKPES